LKSGQKVIAMGAGWWEKIKKQRDFQAKVCIQKTGVWHRRLKMEKSPEKRNPLWFYPPQTMRILARPMRNGAETISNDAENVLKPPTNRPKQTGFESRAVRAVTRM
jgi:hypothetical protein